MLYVDHWLLYNCPAFFVSLIFVLFCVPHVNRLTITSPYLITLFVPCCFMQSGFMTWYLTLKFKIYRVSETKKLINYNTYLVIQLQVHGRPYNPYLWKNRQWIQTNALEVSTNICSMSLLTTIPLTGAFFAPLFFVKLSVDLGRIGWYFKVRIGLSNFCYFVFVGIVRV